MKLESRKPRLDLVLTPTETSWNEMWRRCTQESHPKYPRYGGRGITPCAEWSNYSCFLRDMGERPEGKTLGRRDNDKGYYKDNCEWQTAKQQADNKGDYKNNTSGLRGVSFDTYHEKWAAHTKGGSGVKKRLYFGKDFFEAVCRRKSWEHQNG